MNRKLLFIIFSILLIVFAAERVQAQSDLLSNGDSLLKEKQFDEAIGLYRQALQADSANKAINQKIAKARELKKEAAENYQDAISKGQEYLQKNEYNKAIEAFKTALTNKPDARYPKLKLDEIRQNYEDPEEKKQYKQFVRKADSLMEAYRYKKALTLYNKALEIKPRQVELLKKTKKLDNFIKKQGEREESYNQAITMAENYLENEQYHQALAKYQEASLIKPNKEKPQQKIETIRKQLKKEERKNRQYQTLIDKADSLYMDRKFEQAKDTYQNALSLKPAESYPSNMIAKIDPALAKKQEVQDEYTRLINQGDRAFDNKDYQDAVSFYQKAAEVSPSKNYPEDRLAKIREILNQQKTRYESLIADGDTLQNQKELNEALASYRAALNIYPDKEYPQNQIEKLNNQLATAEQKEKRYNLLITKADSLRDAGTLEMAITSYEEASGIYPDKEYPSEQIAMLKERIEDKKSRQQQYAGLVGKGDSLLELHKPNEAKSYYREAISIISDRDYPKEQIEKINEQLAELNDRTAAYKNFVANGDSLFNSQKWELAQQPYRKALEIFSDSAYPEKQIAKAQNRLASVKERQQKYNVAISKADSLKKLDSLSAALKEYNKALAVNEKEYPKNQIEEITATLNERAEAEGAFQKHVNAADSLYQKNEFNQARQKYADALEVFPDSKYPENQIAEIDKKLAEIKKQQENYADLLATADSLYELKQYSPAKTYYQDALAIGGDKQHPQKRIAQIDSMLTARAQKKAAYDSLLAAANQQADSEQYEKALTSLKKASDTYPEKTYPKEQIAEIEKTLAEIRSQEQAYKKAISKADSLFENENFSEAINYYQQAKNYTDDNAYAESRMAESNKLIAERKARNENYRQATAQADSLLESYLYTEARSAYQQALEIKPDDNYAQKQISSIKDSLKRYSDAIQQGDTDFENEKYKSALSRYRAAEKIKPANKELQEKINETEAILEKLHQQMMDKYNKVIADADQLYKNKKFSEAIEAYEEAARIHTEAGYPEEQINQIKKYLREHSLREVITQNTTISDGSEKQFTFRPLGYRDRSQNYIVIEASGVDNRSPKVFLNYGKGETKNGGVVIPEVNAGQTKQYIINLSEHNRWYDNENNWISLYVQDGDLEILNVSIVKGD